MNSEKSSEKKPAKPTTVDAYITQFAPEIQSVLRTLRSTILDATPNLVETIAYNMPCYRYHGEVIYFGAWKKHVGIYPPVPVIDRLEPRIQPYRQPKGNLQIPYINPFPYDLIREIVIERTQRNEHKQATQSEPEST